MKGGRESFVLSDESSIRLVNDMNVQYLGEGPAKFNLHWRRTESALRFLADAWDVVLGEPQTFGAELDIHWPPTGPDDQPVQIRVKIDAVPSWLSESLWNSGSVLPPREGLVGIQTDGTELWIREKDGMLSEARGPADAAGRRWTLASEPQLVDPGWEERLSNAFKRRPEGTTRAVAIGAFTLQEALARLTRAMPTWMESPERRYDVASVLVYAAYFDESVEVEVGEAAAALRKSLGDPPEVGGSSYDAYVKRKAAAIVSFSREFPEAHLAKLEDCFREFVSRSMLITLLMMDVRKALEARVRVRLEALLR